MAKFKIQLYVKNVGVVEFSPCKQSLKHYLLHEQFVQELPKQIIDGIKVCDKQFDGSFNQDYLDSNYFANQTFYTDNTFLEIPCQSPEIFNNFALIWKSCGCANYQIYKYVLTLAD